MFSKDNDKKNANNVNNDEQIDEVIDDTQNEVTYSFTKEQYNIYEAINDDYVGQIVFDSNLINLPFVQADNLYDSNGNYYKFYLEDGTLVKKENSGRACNGQCTGNEVYIWTNWKTGKYDRIDEAGSVFADYRNTLNDQNYMIFGHHIARDYDPNGNKQFTPLDLLLDQENYEDNKTLKVFYEDKVISYEVVTVVYVDINKEENMFFFRINYSIDLNGNKDENYFSTFKALIDKNQKYSTGVDFSEDDKFLTLITCIQHKPSYREMIICKQTDVNSYN